MNTETKIYSAYISRFVDIAIRYDFSYIKITYGSKEYPFSIPLTPLIEEIERGYSLFVDDVYMIENTLALRDRFLPNIDRYNAWYCDKKSDIVELFGEINVYSITNETLQFTKKYIDEVAGKKLEGFQQSNKFESNKVKPDDALLKINNPYPEIFPNSFSYKLFERLHNDFKDSNNQLADFSFIYRKMYSLNYILEYQKPEMFRKWLSKDPFGIVLPSPFKTLDRCRTDNKETNFRTIFDLVSKEHGNVP